MLMFTQHTKVVTYFKELPPIYSHDPLKRWSFKVTRQIKYISPLAGNLWAPG